MIFDLVGPDFVAQFFPNEEIDRQILDRPSMQPESRRRLQVDAQNWLQGALNKVVSEVKCQRHPIAEDRGWVPPPPLPHTRHPHTHTYLRPLSIMFSTLVLHTQIKEVFYFFNVVFCILCSERDM